MLTGEGIERRPVSSSAQARLYPAADSIERQYNGGGSGLPEGRAHAAATTKEPSKWPSCCRTTGSRRAEHSSDKRRAGQGVFPGRLQTAHNRSGTASAAGVKVCLPDA